MGLNRTLFASPRLLLAGLFVLVGFGAYASSAAAQEGEVTSLTTYVRLCLEPGCTEDLALTENVDGVPVSVADAATGDPIGDCVTGDVDAGACAVEIPAGIAAVTITLDDTAFPEGYVASDNPGTLDLANATEYPFLLMPADGFPEEPAEQDSSPVAEAVDDGQGGEEAADAGVSQLPTTGSGSTAVPTDVLLTGLTALASILGVVALGARRFLQR